MNWLRKAKDYNLDSETRDKLRRFLSSVDFVERLAEDLIRQIPKIMTKGEMDSIQNNVDSINDTHVGEIGAKADELRAHVIEASKKLSEGLNKEIKDRIKELKEEGRYK